MVTGLPAAQARDETELDMKDRESRIEQFRELTRDQGLRFAEASRRMGICDATAANYEKILIERTGKTRAEHLYQRWKELVDSGMPKARAAAQVGISRTAYYKWETNGGPQPRRTTSSPDAIARAHAARSARREERIEQFRVLTREQGLTIVAAARAMGLSGTVCRRYEAVLIERTGKTRQQHLYDRLQELLAAGHLVDQAADLIGVPVRVCLAWLDKGRPARDSTTEGIIQASATKRAAREERIEQFRRLTREKGLQIKEACDQLGISAATGSDYEQELTRRTGLTCREYRRKVYKELRALMPRAQAAQFINLPYSTAAGWDRELGINTRLGRNP